MEGNKLRLFEAFGVELEYMIVDRDTLQVRPIADELLKHELGNYGGDVERGLVTWSNELVLHVIELKSTAPSNDLHGLQNRFADNIRYINAILKRWNGMLMPTAAHPFMNPEEETRLWPHDNNEVYKIYNEIFNCKGHGWSNLQSTHLNLPFSNEEEFAKLHAAIRMVLPILPALSASSPILDGKVTGFLDTRLHFYKTNQAKIPSITAKVIPEPIFNYESYKSNIYDKIKSDIKSFDAEDILDPVWVNSRGAIPRFDRGSIEIRVMDIQECPAADMAIVQLVIETIRAFVEERFATYKDQCAWMTEELANIFNSTIQTADTTVIANESYLKLFGKPSKMLARDLWSSIYEHLKATPGSELSRYENQLHIILEKGTLAKRILTRLTNDLRRESVKETYQLLCKSLEENRMFG